jgi:hypothetical protein
LLYTIKELTVRPGYSLRDYLNGKRAYHFNPLLFLILIGGLTSLLFANLHLNLPVKEIELEKIEAFSSTLAHKYFAIVGLIFITLLTLTDYLIHFNKKYNLPELIVINTFQVGQAMILTFLFLPLFLVQNYVSEKFAVNIEVRIALKATILVFLFFTRWQFYEAKGNYRIIAKIVIQLIIVYTLYNEVIARAIVHWQT